jgi:hypothetical protein
LRLRNANDNGQLYQFGSRMLPCKSSATRSPQIPALRESMLCESVIGAARRNQFPMTHLSKTRHP